MSTRPVPASPYSPLGSAKLTSMHTMSPIPARCASSVPEAMFFESPLCHLRYSTGAPDGGMARAALNRPSGVVSRTPVTTSRFRVAGDVREGLDEPRTAGLVHREGGFREHDGLDAVRQPADLVHIGLDEGLAVRGGDVDRPAALPRRDQGDPRRRPGERRHAPEDEPAQRGGDGDQPGRAGAGPRTPGASAAATAAGTNSTRNSTPQPPVTAASRSTAGRSAWVVIRVPISPVGLSSETT